MQSNFNNPTTSKNTQKLQHNSALCNEAILIEQESFHYNNFQLKQTSYRLTYSIQVQLLAQ